MRKVRIKVWAPNNHFGPYHVFIHLPFLVNMHLKRFDTRPSRAMAYANRIAKAFTNSEISFKRGHD